MRATRTVAFCVGMTVAVMGQVQAASVTLSTSDSEFDPGIPNQGWWSPTSSGNNLSPDYLTGAAFGSGSRSFFTFDLSSLGATDTITSAVLNIQRFVSSPLNSTNETLGIFDVSTDAATLNNNAGPDATIYNDLGSGVSYGQFSVLGQGDSFDILSFSLNPAAISDLNAAKGGFFSLGISLISQSGSDFLFASFSATPGPQTLVLDVEQAAVVPEPTSMILFGISGLGLIGYRYRRRPPLASV